MKHNIKNLEETTKFQIVRVSNYTVKRICQTYQWSLTYLPQPLLDDTHTIRCFLKPVLSCQT